MDSSGGEASLNSGACSMLSEPAAGEGGTGGELAGMAASVCDCGEMENPGGRRGVANKASSETGCTWSSNNVPRLPPSGEGRTEDDEEDRVVLSSGWW